MADIREILAALSPDDRAMYMEARNNMRANYLHTHNLAVGIGNWDQSDDSFFDLIDIKLALLFDRGGKLNATKQIIGNEHEKIEEEIHADEDKMKIKNPVATAEAAISNALNQSEASKKLQNGGWSSNV